ncbi:hypothetical protein K488DRAFT_48877 [Vararia minispora EC-137]|uniref:Uncharacterized protein n=1 Tax=Vararia minispora EC-137 TaxID=1314806 RepID=A0ACB8QMM0_9AGAM|nr:hypothetical protein K488DRAFT_48877 [Vararia minispora EC-137]
MTVTHRKRQQQPEEITTINEPGFLIECDGCYANLTHSIRIKCADPVCEPGDGVDICPSCFCAGREFRMHKRWHAYRVVELHSYPIFSDDWGADEELLLIEGISLQGMGNWEAIAEHIGTRTKDDVEQHYRAVYIDSPNWPLPLTDKHFDVDPAEFQERKRRRLSALPSTAPAGPAIAPTSAPGIHEIATFLPGRLEFEHELDNDAEDLVKDLQFGLVGAWGGDDIVEDEADADVQKRARWAEERRLHPDRTPNLNGIALPNGLANGRAPSPTPAPAPTPAPKEEERGAADDDDDNEESLPPIPFETADSITFKLTLLQMYLQRAERREEGKRLIFQRGLLEYKKMQAADKKRPRDDKEIVHRLRPFAKLQTAEDYEVFCADILYESMLRKRIAELQNYRRLGITNAADVQRLEEDTYKRKPESAYVFLPPTPTVHTDPPPAAPLNLANSPLLHLLTPAEQTLCATLRILPKPYLVIKETLVREYARRGGKLRRREARDLVRIDVNKTNRVWDFLMQGGYLSIGGAEKRAEKERERGEKVREERVREGAVGACVFRCWDP